MQEEDDLGYYHDGTKRTLTDDQIAMFRHSEIYAILRDRQVRKENRQADADNGPDVVEPNPEPTSEGMMLSEDEKESVHNAENSGEKRENTVMYQRTGSELSPGHNKRKRNNSDDGGRVVKGFTSRRLAREMDTATVEDCVLDYGDEPIAEEPVAQTHPYEANSKIEENSQKENDPVTGRKIWWPVLEAT